MRRLSLTVVLASSLALALAGVARADVTLGTTAPALGASAQLCASDLVIAEVGSDPTTPFTVPGPGTITQWQTNVSVDTPGSPLVLVVLKPGTNFHGGGRGRPDDPRLGLPQATSRPTRSHRRSP